MNCYECGGTLHKVTNPYTYSDPHVGEIVVSGIPYYQCDSCDEVLLTEKISIAIEEERERRITWYLKQSPVSAFVTSSEAAKILGVTRQAFNKNRRIKRGFIYQTTLGDISIFLYESVMQYMRTGDGRFPIPIYISPYQYESLQFSNVNEFRYTGVVKRLYKRQEWPNEALSATAEEYEYAQQKS